MSAPFREGCTVWIPRNRLTGEGGYMTYVRRSPLGLQHAPSAEPPTTPGAPQKTPPPLPGTSE